MNQRTHAWIAVRTIALLEDGGKSKNLVKLLKPHAGKAAIGAWIPDLADARRAGSAIGNHVFKIKPFKGKIKERFIADKKELLKRLGQSRLMTQYIKNDKSLKSNWWDKPYKANVTKPGQHIANRAMAMSVMMRDLLIMGEDAVDKLLPGTVSFAEHIHKNARTQAEQVALYFFMLSHFVADACMPCHADARKLALYDKGLHKQLESNWSDRIGDQFDKDQLLPVSFSISPDQILQQARKVDEKFGITFKPKVIPALKKDVWLDVVNVSRGSFTVASIIAPPDKYPYNSDKLAPFKKVFGSTNTKMYKDMSRMVMHDAVLNNAIIWRHIWQKASKS